MKRLILFELIILFLATTFESDSPPGWFQQTLPVTEIVRDIFFLDSSTGWVVSSNQTFPANDTGYIMKTTNGGNNWVVQLDSMFNYYVVQFLDINNGFAAGGTGRAKFLKTTNSGGSWSVTTPFGSNMYAILDLAFVNKDTGWVCGDDLSGGGVFKTTNGGVSWQSQLGASFKPTKLFFLNKDTGWANCNGVVNSGSYRTTNGGINWELMDAIGFIDMHFFNRFIGIRTSGEFYKSTNGGLNWFVTSSLTGGKLSFVSDSTGWAANDLSRITKTTTGGNSWFYQSSPIFNNLSISAVETLKAWAGGNGLVHTTDGGGPPIGIIYASSEVSNYKLDQNFPNPFNPTTIIFFKLQEKSTVELLVYNILGEEVAEMVDDDHFTAGVYQFGFDASKYDLPSGVYFYRLTAKSEVSGNIFIDTKKMILLK